jgi:hypothetical protein
VRGGYLEVVELMVGSGTAESGMTIQGMLLCEQLSKRKIVVQLGQSECSVPHDNHLHRSQIKNEMWIPL